MGLVLAPKMCDDQSQAFKEVNNNQALTVRRKKDTPFFCERGASRCSKACLYKVSRQYSKNWLRRTNIKSYSTPNIEHTIKPSNYDVRPWFLHFTAQKLKCSRRFWEIRPWKIAHVFNAGMYITSGRGSYLSVITPYEFFHLDRWQWKRDVSIKSWNFKDTRPNISVPLAMSTKKKSFKLFKNPEKNNSWADLGQRSAWEKLSRTLTRSGEIPSPRQTSIDKTNDCAIKSERGALVRGSHPPSGHSVHRTTTDTWRRRPGVWYKHIRALLCRKQATNLLIPLDGEK